MPASCKMCGMAREEETTPAVVPNELGRIGAFKRVVQDRSATTLIPLPWGTAVFNDRFPRSWAHNFVRVEGAADVAAEEVIAEAERLHVAARHRHRQVLVEVEATALRLQPGFVAAGYSPSRLVTMVLRRDPGSGAAGPAVEVDFDTVKPALEHFYWTSPYGDSEETIRQLVERNLVTAAATDVRHFAVVVDGRVASTCQLYSDGRTAQVEDVTTLEEFRNRGFARAVVTRAADEARSAGADLVFLEADDDDWPKELYARLGFEETAFGYEFTRPGSARGEATS